MWDPDERARSLTQACAHTRTHMHVHLLMGPHLPSAERDHILQVVGSGAPATKIFIAISSLLPFLRAAFATAVAVAVAVAAAAPTLNKLKESLYSCSESSKDGCIN